MDKLDRTVFNTLDEDFDDLEPYIKLPTGDFEKNWDETEDMDDWKFEDE